MPVVIIGLGGGGSHLAYYLSKVEKELILVDNDTVEFKNLERQLYTKEDVGKPKAEALTAFLEKASPECLITPLVRRIESKLDLADIPPNYFCFAGTDNMASKCLIMKYFDHCVAAGCERDYLEITDAKGSYDHTWSAGTGYESTQTFETNLLTASLLFHLYQRFMKNGTRIGRHKVEVNGGVLKWIVTSK